LGPPGALRSSMLGLVALWGTAAALLSATRAPKPALLSRVPANASSLLRSSADASAAANASAPNFRLGSAWYINLDDWTGRRAEMETAYRRTGLRYMRFPAVRPTLGSLDPGGQWNTLYEHFQAQRKPELYDPVMAGKIRGEIGCIASHLQLLKHIKATGRAGEVYLLAEDDYAPTADFKTKLPTVLQHLPPDWDTVRFDCWEGTGPSGFIQRLDRFPQVKQGLYLNNVQGCSTEDARPITGRPECQFCGGTHAVLVSYEKIDKMMQLWSGVKGPLFALDCMLTRPDFKNYCLQWGLFNPVPHLKTKTSIPKAREHVTQWHIRALHSLPSEHNATQPVSGSANATSQAH